MKYTVGVLGSSLLIVSALTWGWWFFAHSFLTPAPVAQQQLAAASVKSASLFMPDQLPPPVVPSIAPPSPAPLAPSPYNLAPNLPPLTAKFAFNARGAHVTALQEMLAVGEFYAGTAGGVYDEATIKAVQAFQTKYNINTTPETFGLAGPATRAELNAIYAKQ